MKSGAGFLLRNLGGYIENGENGAYNFTALQNFLDDAPYEYTITVARQIAQSPTLPPQLQSRLPIRGVVRLRAGYLARPGNLSINYGFRYEYSGAPVNVGTQPDDLIVLGPGAHLPSKLLGAGFVQSSGHQALYEPIPAIGHRGWASPGRLGVICPSCFAGLTVFFTIGRTTIFGKQWKTIPLSPRALFISIPRPCSISISPRPACVFSGTLSPIRQYFLPTLFQPGLRNAMVQSAFTGLQSRMSQAVTIELNGLASRARDLLTRDIVNRAGAMINPDLPPISYQANQGFSNYAAATALAKFNLKHLQGQAAYTWSHSIDNEERSARGLQPGIHQRVSRRLTLRPLSVCPAV